MTALDPAEIFRTEAAELLACLERRCSTGRPARGPGPGRHRLPRLHTIKGSGAMFGFEQVAAFTHDFETAFDRVRSGEVPVGRGPRQRLALRQDYIAASSRSPRPRPDHRRGPSGRARAAPRHSRHRRADGVPAHPLPRPSRPRPSSPPGRLADRHRLRPDVLRNGTNPLALLDELRDPRPLHGRARLDPARTPGLDPRASSPAGRDPARARDPRGNRGRVPVRARRDGPDPGAGRPGAADAAPPEPAEVLAPRGRSRRLRCPRPRRPSLRPPAGRRRVRCRAAAAARRAEERPASSVGSRRSGSTTDGPGRRVVIAQARLSQLAGLSADPGLKGIAEEIERLSARLRDTTIGASAWSPSARCSAVSAA